MPTKKFSERTFTGQLATVAGICATMGLPVGVIFLAAADARIDSKYATDNDLQRVQELVATQVDEIKMVVDRNTVEVTQTLAAVDNLSLVVLDIQITGLQEQIARLDASQAKWSRSEQEAYREKRRALQDSERKRQQLYDRVLRSN